MEIQPKTLPLYQSVFEISPVPSWIFDKATLKFLEINTAACKRYGYTREEFLDMQITDIRSGQDKIALKRYLELNAGEKQAAARFWEHINKKGSSFYVQVYCRDIDFGGNIATLVQATDVNDMVLTDHENRRLNAIVNSQKEQLTTILSSVNEVVWAANAQTMELLYTNPASMSVFGYSSEEISADKNLFYSRIHADDRDKFQQSVEEAMSMGESNCIFRMYHRDGTLKILKGHAVFRKGRGREPDMLSGITSDITAYLRMEEKLQHKLMEEQLMKQRLSIEEHNLKALINNTSDLIWSIDKNRRLITANEPFKKAMRTTFGVELEPGYDMGAIDVAAEVYHQWEEYYDKVFVESCSFSIIDEQVVNGHKVYLKIRFNPIFDEREELLGVSCFAQDVTEQRTRLIRIQLQNERLKEIAWIHSHKVRGPVATMMGLANLFNLDKPGDKENAEIIDGLKKTLNELDTIIREINGKTTTEEVWV